MSTDAAPSPRAGGILAGQTLLDRWLHISLVVLVVASVARYLQGQKETEQAELEEFPDRIARALQLAVEAADRLGR